MDSLIYITQWVNYGLLKRKPAIDFSQIPANVPLHLGYDKKHKVHWAIAANLPGFEVTGKTEGELADNIWDTLLVYFDIPTYFARRKAPPSAVFEVTDKKKHTTKTFEVHARKELDKVLA